MSELLGDFFVSVGIKERLKGIISVFKDTNNPLVNQPLSDKLKSNLKKEGAKPFMQVGK